MAKKTYSTPEDARNAILDAAAAIVVKVGPAGLRISEVAKKAGMAHPNLIHHFGSREGMIDALAARVGERATERVAKAISDALSAPADDQIAALTRVFDSAYQGDEGLIAVWLHLSGVEGALKPAMQRIAELSHEFRKSVNGDADIANTRRLVMLVTLALLGEVISGSGVRDALGFGEEETNRAHFRQWLAGILLKLTDEDLRSSLSNHKVNDSSPTKSQPIIDKIEQDSEK